MSEAAGVTAPELSPATVTPEVPRDPFGHPVPPPMRTVRKGWFTARELSKAEAERWHLLQAAELAGNAAPEAVKRQLHHLREAFRNRAWQRIAPEAG